MLRRMEREGLLGTVSGSKGRPVIPQDSIEEFSQPFPGLGPSESPRGSVNNGSRALQKNAKGRKTNPRFPGLKLEPVPAAAPSSSHKRKASVVETPIHQDYEAPARKSVRFSNVNSPQRSQAV
jgi:hypothetical protein